MPLSKRYKNPMYGSMILSRILLKRLLKQILKFFLGIHIQWFESFKWTVQIGGKRKRTDSNQVGWIHWFKRRGIHSTHLTPNRNKNTWTLLYSPVFIARNFSAECFRCGLSKWCHRRQFYRLPSCMYLIEKIFF